MCYINATIFLMSLYRQNKTAEVILQEICAWNLNTWNIVSNEIGDYYYCYYNAGCTIITYYYHREICSEGTL